MRFTTLVVLPFALAAPLLTTRQQLIPTLPSLGIPAIRDQIHARITQTFGVSGPRDAYYGDLVNEYIPFADTLKEAITAEKVNEIDILADRLCIAGSGQGSLCNELLAYAHAWYVAQQNGWTYEFVSRSLGVSVLPPFPTPSSLQHCITIVFQPLSSIRLRHLQRSLPLVRTSNFRHPR